MQHHRLPLVPVIFLAAAGILCLEAGLCAQRETTRTSPLRVLKLGERNAGSAALENAQNLFERYRAMHPMPLVRSEKEKTDFESVVSAYDALIRKYANSEIEADVTHVRSSLPDGR